MNKRSLISAVMLLVIGAYLAFALPLAKQGMINVTVLDNNTNAPIKGATIEIIETKQQAKTDASGVANISVKVAETGASTYTVKADHPSYIYQIQKNISVSANNTTTVSFHLSTGYEKKDKVTLNQESLITGHIASGAMSAPMYARKGIGGGFAAFADDNFNTEDYSSIAENEFKSARENPLSTFSIDVDNASYSNVRRFITQGSAPPKDAVRIEEMINYFTYDYPQPTGDHPFSVNMESTVCPWDRTHQVVIVGLQGKEIPQEKTSSGKLDLPH